MELKRLHEKVYYIPNATNIGVIKGRDNNVVLVDSGLDDETAKKILRVMSQEQLNVSAIINTHSHADHCGGNCLIKERTGARIYAPGLEAEIIESPYLEPLYLFSGARPVSELKTKFLMARKSEVDEKLSQDTDSLEIGDICIGIVRLPGHSPNQIGVSYEGVLFCADAFFSGKVLAKHKIPFYSDVGMARETLERMRSMQFEWYVPSHAEPTESIAKLADAHLSATGDIQRAILGLLKDAKTTGQAVKELSDHLGIEIKTQQQYYLMNTATMAYLSYLADNGLADMMLQGNSLFWKAK